MLGGGPWLLSFFSHSLPSVDTSGTSDRGSNQDTMITVRHAEPCDFTPSSTGMAPGRLSHPQNLIFHVCILQTMRTNHGQGRHKT